MRDKDPHRFFAQKGSFLRLASFITSIVVIATAVTFSGYVSARDSQKVRQDIVTRSFGQPPKGCDGDPKNIAESLVSQTSAYRLIRVSFSDCAGQVSALVGIPVKQSPTTVIALPQTSAEGADEVMGIRGDAKLSFGLRFLEAGYTVISPDVFIAGQNYDPKRNWNTTDQYAQYPNWSAAGRMVADNEMAAKLAKRYAPKTKCTVAVGHSLGGHNALFLAYFDHDIDLVISNSGFEMMKDDENPSRWARKTWFRYFGKQPDWDFDDILDGLKDRKVMLFQGDKDPIWKNSGKLPADVAALGLKNVSLTMFHGAHEFTAENQLKALDAIKDCRMVH